MADVPHSTRGRLDERGASSPQNLLDILMHPSILQLLHTTRCVARNSEKGRLDETRILACVSGGEGAKECAILPR